MWIEESDDVSFADKYLLRNIIPNDFEFTTSRFNVTWVTCDKLCQIVSLNILKLLIRAYKSVGHLPHTQSSNHIWSIIQLVQCIIFISAPGSHKSLFSIQNSAIGTCGVLNVMLFFVLPFYLTFTSKSMYKWFSLLTSWVKRLLLVWMCLDRFNCIWQKSRKETLAFLLF